MFTFTSKRQREHEDPVDGVHDRKRPRPLIIQPPNVSQKPSSFDPYPEFGLPTLTPVESSDDDGDDTENVRYHPQCTGDIQQLDLWDAGHSPMDVDSNKEPSSLNDGSKMQLWPTCTRTNDSSQPSPIPHSLINHSLTLNDRRPLSPFPSHTSSPASGVHGSQPPPSQTLDVTMTTFKCSQRLPSPVSEGEDPPPVPATKSVDAGDEANTESSQHAPFPNEDVAQRSNAAFAKKKKVALAMGFRADCDKCRHKVPGHYSHIIHV